VGNSPVNATDATGTISRTQVSAKRSPGTLTVNWKFQLDKACDEPIVLIQRVEVTTRWYNPNARRLTAGRGNTVMATTSYFEVVGVIYPAGSDDPNSPNYNPDAPKGSDGLHIIQSDGRKYDDTWSLENTAVNSFGAGLAGHLTTGIMAMRGQIRAFKLSDVKDETSGWSTNQTFQGGSGSNTGFPMTSGTFPASQEFYGTWKTKWVEAETVGGKAFVHTETISQSKPTASGGFPTQRGNSWFPLPH